MRNSKSSRSLVQFEILGAKWKARVVPKKEVHKKYGPTATENIIAYTDFANSCIYISYEGFTLHNIRHEVTHILFDSLCLDTTSGISLDDIEEIVCEFAATHVDTIRFKSMEIFRGLR